MTGRPVSRKKARTATATYRLPRGAFAPAARRQSSNSVIRGPPKRLRRAADRPQPRARAWGAWGRAPGWLEILTYKRNTRYHAVIMGILTVRLTDQEEQVLTRRARLARVKRATYVRMLIREEPFLTGADILADAIKRKGDVRLRVSRRS